MEVTLLANIYVYEIGIYFEFMLLITNNRSGIKYCDWRGRIFRFLNKSVQESVILYATINSIIYTFTYLF